MLGSGANKRETFQFLVELLGAGTAGRSHVIAQGAGEGHFPWKEDYRNSFAEAWFQQCPLGQGRGTAVSREVGCWGRDNICSPEEWGELFGFLCEAISRQSKMLL